MTAPADGTVIGVDNHRLARIARLSGAPQVRGAGIDLMVKLGDEVRAGQTLYRVHAQFDADLEFARRMATSGSGFTLGAADQVPRDYATSPADAK
jgi:thymidine phosphorylase